jgi:hypothetical protein
MKIGLVGAMAALKAYADARGGDVVSPEELRDRTAVCRSCPKRKLSSGILTKVSEKLGILANAHRVPKDVSAYSCGVCGCSLMLLLPARGVALHKDTPEEARERPDSCWIKKVDAGSGKG